MTILFNKAPIFPFWRKIGHFEACFAVSGSIYFVSYLLKSGLYTASMKLGSSVVYFGLFLKRLLKVFIIIASLELYPGLP